MAKKDVDLKRLSQAIQRSRLVLRYPRQQRALMVREYVGAHWSENGSNRQVPVNLLALYCGIVGRSLIAKDPRVMLSTFQKDEKAAVETMESWANKEIQEMHLASTLQRIVFDALFSVGIAKVALATPADSAAAGWNLPAGQPFADRVDLDDFVFDINARRFEDVSWIGHRFRAPLDAVRDSTLYTAARKSLVASTDQPMNPEGDEKISVLGRTYYATDAEELFEWVDLWEIYIPRHRLVVTLADDDIATGATFKPIREVEWLGPDSGPYAILGLGMVPGNIMPKGPVQDLYDLHESVNRLYRKLLQQAERQKTFTAVQGGANEDGTRTVNVSDGEAIKLDNPEKVAEVVMGGPHQGNFLFVDHLWQLFSKMGGNLEMLGGLAPQSKTLGQDKLLAGNSSSQMASMQQDVTTFTGGIIQKLCWYWWHHPQQVMRVKYNVPGLKDVGITRQLHPAGRENDPNRLVAAHEMGVRGDIPDDMLHDLAIERGHPWRKPPALRRKGRWVDLEINVDPYSLQDQTPQGNVQALTQIVMQTIQPLMPLLQQQGIGLDLNVFLSKLGKYLNLPDLAEIVQYQEPPTGEQGQGPGGGMPAQTSREYVRRSLGGDSQQGQEADLRAKMAKGLTSGQQNGQLSPAGMP